MIEHFETSHSNWLKIALDNKDIYKIALEKFTLRGKCPADFIAEAHILLAAMSLHIGYRGNGNTEPLMVSQKQAYILQLALDQVHGRRLGYKAVLVPQDPGQPRDLFAQAFPEIDLTLDHDAREKMGWQLWEILKQSIRLVQSPNHATITVNNTVYDIKFDGDTAYDSM